MGGQLIGFKKAYACDNPYGDLRGNSQKLVRLMASAVGANKSSYLSTETSAATLPPERADKRNVLTRPAVALHGPASRSNSRKHRGPKM
jgi:hypothetical protein